MIGIQTRVVVADNSGGLVAQVFRILGHSNRKVAKVGDLVVVSIKETPSSGGKNGRKQAKEMRGGSTGGQKGKPGSLTGVRKGEVHKALVVRTKVNYRLNPHGLNGMQFEDNAIVLLNNKLEPIGTRIFGPINSFELRRLGKPGYLKVLSLAQLSL